MNRRNFIKTTGVGISGAFIANNLFAISIKKRPNVILIMTDDQGFGDLGCSGNPKINTPHIDNLSQESVQLNDFHVSPTCAPTRGALMTGKYSNRIGAWHTIMARQMMYEDEQTMADVFKYSGYKTAMFGKWHLGDNFPFRPMDRGFDETVVHGGGGITQGPDYWGNDYFDDTYWHNGNLQEYKGYCTDVFFQESIRFIEKNKNNPFFCYISTNAPHGPFNVPEKYATPYLDKGIPAKRAAAFGMIENIDENIGKLEKKLKNLGLYENTILFFITDNGTARGVSTNKQEFVIDGYNAGMRGKKARCYEGGHRVPCFIRWPEKGLNTGEKIEELTAHIDILPTLIDFCNLQTKKKIDFDGMSLSDLIFGKENDIADRTIVVDNQRLKYLRKYKQFSVMHKDWRLVGNFGKRTYDKGEKVFVDTPIVDDPLKNIELYDMKTDFGQTKNMAAQYPNVVKKLMSEYEKWWTRVSEKSEKISRIIIGSKKENPTELYSHDWHQIGEEFYKIPFAQKLIRTMTETNGYWALKVAGNGKYEISLRRWPKSEDLEICAGLPGRKENHLPGKICTKIPKGKAIPITSAKIKIGDIELSKPVNKTEKEITFRVNLKKGDIDLYTWFISDDKSSRGAYFAYIKKI